MTGRQAEMAGSLAPVSIRIWACNPCIIHLVVARVSRMGKIVRSPVVGKGLDQAWVLGAATRLSARALHRSPSPRSGRTGFPRRGRRAEKRKPFGVRDPLPDHGGRPPARHTRLRSRCEALAHAISWQFLRTTPGRAFAVSVPLPRQRTQVKVTLGACVLDPRVVDLTVVSQLLAGPRSGHGRSPGAARVPDCEPDPRAPRPVPHHDAS